MNGSAQASTLAMIGPASHPRGRDPLALILGPTERWNLTATWLGVAVALHLAVISFGVAAGWLHDLRLAVDDNRARLHEYYWRMYDIEVEKPKDPPKDEPPPPPDPPPPAPAPAPKAVAKLPDDPYKDVAPTPAKAAKVLTAEPKPDEPVNFENTIVSGEGTAVGGVQSGAGQGDKITFSRAARNDGVPGGRGAAPAPTSPPAAVDKSRPVALAGSQIWNCPFPPEADADQIDQAVVGVSVTVRPDGSAATASVLSDPGHGFGRAARQCALARRYQPALDRDGQAIVQSATVNVRFTR